MSKSLNMMPIVISIRNYSNILKSQDYLEKVYLYWHVVLGGTELGDKLSFSVSQRDSQHSLSTSQKFESLLKKELRKEQLGVLDYIIGIGVCSPGVKALSWFLEWKQWV